MYKISEFSKITGLSVKALRYYDDEGILIPSRRDENNAYRIYDGNDYQRARLIAFLRDLDFSIAEIKEVLGSSENENDIYFFLTEKKKRIDENIEREKAIIDKILLYTKPDKTESKDMDYQITIKEYPSVNVAAIRFNGSYSDIGKHIGTVYRAVRGGGSGAPICLLYDNDYEVEADIEICVPISVAVNDRAVKMKKLPQVKALSTIHKGSYESLHLAYKALVDYANSNKLKLLTPSREVFTKGPGHYFKGNEDGYITEIIIPFEEEVENG